MLVLTGARMYRDYPALDRSGDTPAARHAERPSPRASTIGTACCSPISTGRSQNGLTYFARHEQPRPGVRALARGRPLRAGADSRQPGDRPRRRRDRAGATGHLDAAYGPLLTVQARRPLRSVPGRASLDDRCAACLEARATCSARFGRRRSSRSTTEPTCEETLAGSDRRPHGGVRPAATTSRSRDSSARRPVLVKASDRPIPRRRRARRRARRRPNGVVARVRHDSADGLRTGGRRPSPHAHRRARRQLRRRSTRRAGAIALRLRGQHLRASAALLSARGWRRAIVGS